MYPIVVVFYVTVSDCCSANDVSGDVSAGSTHFRPTEGCVSQSNASYKRFNFKNIERRPR